MSKPKNEGKSKERLFTDADDKIWHELQSKTAKRAKSLGVTSESDIERIIAEVREQNP
jgi:hypothetical protein